MVNELIILGLGWLLMKGMPHGTATATKGPAKSPTKAPWPEAHYPDETPKEGYGVRMTEEGKPVMPVMQKGMPGVSTFAHSAVEQMIREKEAREAEQGTGKRAFHPAKHATPAQAAKARELLPGWHPGARWRDVTDPSTMYVAKVHQKQYIGPMGIPQTKNVHAVEVWTSSG